MSVIFYPAMGIDVVTPILCIKNLNKIVATGPVPKNFAKHGRLGIEKTVDFICDLIKTGTNEFYEGKDVDDDHFIEFFIEEASIVKRHNFKSISMYVLQIKYAEKPITVYWYYDIDPVNSKDPWPFKDQFDYVINKGFPINVKSPKNSFMKNLKPLLKKGCKLISTKSELRGQWQIPKENMNALQPMKEYEFIVEQTKYRSENGQFQSVYCVDMDKMYDKNEGFVSITSENKTPTPPPQSNQSNQSNQPNQPKHTIELSLEDCAL